MYKRMDPKERQAEILTAAVDAAKRLGYSQFRLVDVAAGAQCSTGSVMRYWKTMEQLRRDVMRAAIRDEVLQVIGVGVAINDPCCRKLCPTLRARALASL